MVSPYDYSGLVGGFQAPQEAFVNQIKLREVYLQQEKAKQDAAAMKAALQDYTNNPTPQKLANLHLNFPSLKGTLDAYTQTLSDADKRTTTEFATQAFSLNRANKPEEVVGLFDRYISAAESSNRPDMARVLKDAKDTYSKIEDPNQREALIGSVLAGTGKDGMDIYNNIWKSNLDLDTSLIKNVVALGFKPGTPEFKKKLAEQMDKITITRPDGTFIQGTPEQIQGVLGQGGGKVMPKVTTQEEAMRLPPGTQFIGPDNKVYRVPMKAGGQTGPAPSDNFR